MSSTLPSQKPPRALPSAKDLALAPVDWVEERSGLVSVGRFFLFRNVPSDISFLQTLGSAALTIFIVQVTTGIILAMYYDPSTSQAYDSIRYITDTATLGWLVRGMHKWGSTMFVIVLFLHMGRTFLFGAYKYPRELTWITGALIFILVMAMSLTGYLLVFDQRAYWATVVARQHQRHRADPRAVHLGVPEGRAGVHDTHAGAVLRAAHAGHPGRDHGA